MTSVNVRIDKELFDAAAIEGRTKHRSAAQQINFWAKVGRNALANPDLPIDYVAQLLIAKDLPDEHFEFRAEKQQKIKLLRQAGNDPEFLARCAEVQEDFKHID